MKNLKKKIGLVFMTFAMLCSIIPEFDIKLHANEYYTFNETLNEDQSEAVIELSIKQQIGKKVQKIELPDQSEAELTTDENGTTKTSYTVKENGKYDFKITYQEEKTDSLEVSEPLSAEELEETLSYEVKDIKDIAIKEEEKEEEETVKNEVTQKLGLAAEGEYVAQAVHYKGSNPGIVLKEFKTLQEAFDYGATLRGNASYYGETKYYLEILKDVIVDEPLIYPKLIFDKDYTTLNHNFYSLITTSSNYTGSSTDGRAILKRGPNNKGALIDRTNFTYGRDDNVEIDLMNGRIMNLILDGGKSEGLSGDSLIISGQTDGSETMTGFYLENVKLMNNENIKGSGGAVRVIHEKTSFNNVDIIDCETMFDGGAIYIETFAYKYSLNTDGLGFFENTTITDCLARGDGGGIAAKNSSVNTSTKFGYQDKIEFSNVSLTNNHANGNGGGAYLSVAKVIIRRKNSLQANPGRIDGFVATNNSADLLGAGIFFTTGVNKYDQNLDEANSQFAINHNTVRNKYKGYPVTYKIFDNKDAETKGNLYLDDGVNLDTVYEIDNINDKNNIIGVTLVGKDAYGVDRMADGAEIGNWRKKVKDNIFDKPPLPISDPKTLQVIIRDSDIDEHMYAAEGILVDSFEALGEEKMSVVWPKSPLKFTKVDVKDNTKTLANAEFTLYQCDDNTHDHSKDPETDLVKDSTCWKSMKKITSNADGIVDFGEFNSGQYMLVESKAPAGYITPAGQWFIKVNNAPNVVRPQSYHDKVIIMKRGKILPPDLTVTLDSDNLFASAQITNTIGHTVTFDPMGGTMDQSEITQGVAANELLIRPTDPTRDSDIFLGWYKDQGLTEEWNFVTDRVTKDMTLYAKWKEIYVAQAVDYNMNGGNGQVIAKFKTLQEAFDYKGPFVYNIDLEILKDVIIDKTLLYPEIPYNSVVNSETGFYTKITTAPTSNHSASGDPELYTGSSVDGRAILKRGPNNEGALIDKRKYNIYVSDGSGPSNEVIGEGYINDLILDGGSQDGLSGDSLIISGSSSEKTTHGSLTCENVKFMNNNNIKGNGGAIRTIRENAFINKSEFINCRTKNNGGAIYSEMTVTPVNIEGVKISDCSADENGGGIAVMNNSDQPGIHNSHYVSFYSIKFINNNAGSNGGAAYLCVSDLSLIGIVEEPFNGIEITKNKAGKLGSGLYVTTSTFKSDPNLNKKNSKVEINSYNNLGDFYIFDNEDATTKGNLYLDDGVSLMVDGNTINDGVKNNTIGLTLAGKDENGIDRMEEGAELGIWMKDADMSGTKLQTIQRDSDINGYMYADEGKHIDSNDGENLSSIVWPKSPLKFTKVDVKDNTKTLANAEFTLYQCSDNTHDHSKDPVTALVKDSDCWKSIKTVTSNADGIVDFEGLSTGQHMLVESKAPTGYATPEGQWFIKVNNAPNVVRPQSFYDKVTITRRGTVLPPEIEIKLSSDDYFESGQVTNIAEHTITFDPQGGTMLEAEKTQKVIDDNLIIQPTNPTREFFEFDGWYQNSDYTGNPWNFGSDKVTGDVTLYAKWKVSDASYFISIPKQITLEDGMDGYAQKKETISIVKNQADSKWYPEEDILIKTATQITLTNPDNSDSYDVSVYDENDSKHTDSNKELMALNVKDDTKQSADFTLKTPISNTKMKNRYTGIMTFVIQFRP